MVRSDAGHWFGAAAVLCGGSGPCLALATLSQASGACLRASASGHQRRGTFALFAPLVVGSQIPRGQAKVRPAPPLARVCARFSVCILYIRRTSMSLIPSLAVLTSALHDCWRCESPWSTPTFVPFTHKLLRHVTICGRLHHHLGLHTTSCHSLLIRQSVHRTLRHSLCMNSTLTTAPLDAGEWSSLLIILDIPM